MPTTIDGSPSPRAHIKTLMKIGYDFCSAVADIIDNSIAAKCSKVQIFSPPGMSNPFITIVDNGFGMDQDELLQNMVIGCKDPSDVRVSEDLGRFGSGMKTASFSQARKLIVLTKKANQDVVGACWDIDKIIDKNSWCLEKLDEEDISNLNDQGMIYIADHGTQILWQKLSCVQQDSHSLDYDIQIASKLTSVDQHIALHFHRFMAGAQKISMFINNKQVNAIDPFMTSSSGYQEGPKERFRCKGGFIEIQTHVLPSFNRMSKQELKLHGGASEISQRQGLYIYRNKRLINAGGWLNLSKHHQLSALARVQIDIPSALDDEWETDVKKASLQLPPRVKRDLRKFLSDPISRSKKVYTHRGKLEEANTFWKICSNEDENKITYEIHPENATLIELLSKIPVSYRPTLAQYLTKLSQELPLQHIYSTMAERPLDVGQREIESLDIAMMLDVYKGSIRG